ncbi:uncharacterized protein [Cardiocondyla obscurior]|uniref:uncharacterized protein n=1 Tax=Cardiocondyla obscurior TaxID=286306 RepID=UPI0039657D60
MDECYRPATGHFLKCNPSPCVTLTASEKVFTCENNDGCECKTRAEEDVNEQSVDNDSQTSTPSCVSKMDYTLPKYLSNGSSNDSSTSANCISMPVYRCGDNFAENFAVSITAREHLDICFSTPKPFVSTFNGDEGAKDNARSRTKQTDVSLSRVDKGSASGWQEIADLISNGESVVDCEDIIYVSEGYFLLMESNRNRMRGAFSERSRRDSKDSAFSDLVESDESLMHVDEE